MSNQVYIIYHAGCPDGFGAAWAAHRHFSTRLPDKQVHYLPRPYGHPFPKTQPDSEVYILDYSYPPDVMAKAHIRHKGKVVLLDHHESAKTELAGRIPCTYFDLNHSAAHMAWKYWFPQEDTPELIAYIEDQDLWRWELPESREVVAALDSYPPEFATWDNLEVETLKREGRPIARYIDIQVARLTSTAPIMPVLGHMAPVVNSPVHQSEIAHQLLRQNPTARFAAVFSDRPLPKNPSYAKRRWSLRSRSREEFNVAELAAQAGGGGHPCAAGFSEVVQTTRDAGGGP